MSYSKLTVPGRNSVASSKLKTILEPLLEDFQSWFSRTRKLLESERISFLSTEEQANLLESVKTNQQEVHAAQMLFKATDGQAGIDTATLVPWHQLVAQCWQVARRWRSLKSDATQNPNFGDPNFDT